MTGERLVMLSASAPLLAEELAKCIGALRGVARGLEGSALAPQTVKTLRDVADDALRVLDKATGAA